MKLISSGFRNDIDYSAGIASELGVVSALDDLEFLNVIQGGAKREGANDGIYIVDAIQQRRIVMFINTGKIETTSQGQVRSWNRQHCARKSLNEAFVLSAIQRQVQEVEFADDSADRGAVGLKQGSAGARIDLLCRSGVCDMQRLIDSYWVTDAKLRHAHFRVEAVSLEFNSINTRGKLNDRIIARNVCFRGLNLIRGDIDDAERNLRNCCSAAVRHCYEKSAGCY